MKKIKIYVYGAGHEYNKFLSYISVYFEKIEIIGIVTTERQSIKVLDGYPCLIASEMEIDRVDFIIIAIEKWKELIPYLKKFGIGGEKIIPSKVFSLPYFHLDSYLVLKKEKITILSNTCLGADVYEELGLEYLSPTIYSACEGEAYLSFVENYEYYLSKDMKISDKEYKYKRNPYCMDHMMPKGILDYKVEWDFLHNLDEKNAVEKWNERRKRCNLDNVAILMVIFTEEEARRFDKLPYKKKLGIYYEDLNLESVVYCSEWNDINIRTNYIYNWIHFANNYMTSTHGKIGKINWLKFLTGKDDYIRF